MKEGGKEVGKGEVGERNSSRMVREADGGHKASQASSNGIGISFFIFFVTTVLYSSLPSGRLLPLSSNN